MMLQRVSDPPFSSQPMPGLLGFDEPLNSADSPIPHALGGWSATPITHPERLMIHFMNEITDKPDWTRKISDEKILKRWQKEFMQSGDDQLKIRLSQRMFEYCIEELRSYVQLLNELGFVLAIDADASVLKSDTLISEELRLALVDATGPLENKPAHEQDWHPGSDGKVLDLVHPSLFPLLYGRSRMVINSEMNLDDCMLFVGKGEVIPELTESEVDLDGNETTESMDSYGQLDFSRTFQWLPCQVDFRPDDEVEITSYINNLLPKHNSDLYRVIEKIIAKTIPMWDAAVDSAERRNRPGRIRIEDVTENWEYPEEEPELYGDENDEDEEEQVIKEWREMHRILIPPDPRDYSERIAGDPLPGLANPMPGLRQEFGDQGLQIIVKLATIHLTPDKPTYDGGSWHIEGMLNEHICASALYYYDSANITDSFLSFREQVDAELLEHDVAYGQNEYDHIERLFDIRNDGPTIQQLGRVRTQQGRLVTFPNVLQHRVEPFHLADATRPGHRKILALFLVDPNVRIPSTAHVPPQQRDWCREMVLSIERIADLPPELVEHIIDYIDPNLVTLAEAKELRDELIVERQAYVEKVEDLSHDRTFNFCEH